MLRLKCPPDPNRMVSAKSVYLLYLMLKGHFNNRYDVLKYNWRMNVSDKAFEKRKDKYFFKRLSEKYNIEELVHIFVSNLVSNENAWVGEISGADALQHYRERYGKIQRINIVYEDDIKNICYLRDKLNETGSVTLKDMLSYNEKNISAIFKMVQSDLISEETFILLDSIFDIINKHDEHSKKNNLIWNDFSVRMTAYKKLLKIDRLKAKDIFIKTVKQHKEIKR